MHAAGFLTAGLAATVPVSAQLNKWAKAAGLRYFGTALDAPGLSNSNYMRITRDPDEFGAITPANGQKWDQTEKSQGGFSYGSGDAISSVTRSSGQLLRCHTLVWHSQLPPWVSNSFSKDQMQRVIRTHIQNVAGHYKGQCYSWDVVNEALNDDGTWRSSPFYRAMGADYIPFAFKVAAEVDPGAKLYYNDFNIERCCNAKINATVDLLRNAIAAGARIDGVGMQGHSRVGKSPSKREMKETMARWATLVNEIALSEVDIRHTQLPIGAAEREQQALDYLEVVGACLETPKCVGISVWDHADQYSWIPGQYPGEGEACLWDKNLQKKPAYTSILNAFKSAAAAKTATATTFTTASPTPTL